jgi:prepilin-type N-terminal cleavage/methylation domain-containing protein
MARAAGEARAGRASGFTLLEVIVAVFLFGSAMGLLIEAVTRSLRALSSTRDELVASELGQRTLAQVSERIARGEAVESESGRYEEPAYMRYELSVEPFTIALPEGVESDPRRPPLATIFTPTSVRADTPEPPLRRVLVRVYREDLGPESAQPLLALVSLPLPKAKGGEKKPGEEDEERDQDEDEQDQDRDGSGGGGSERPNSGSQRTPGRP